ncbi:PorT family protein [Flaviramulus sp. BrNp1-15]|uniref:porin family protein n=1 Tax=Flaviramulus sp. BrNp1-15 TaxID=2916754 RepID=UPI001EE8D7AF|nr:porin family protein [Flaviramulus sp. BrNp1-15]ULC58114.1 PorT family protein [Flaviramulus sp. BrNp1-15]
MKKFLLLTILLCFSNYSFSQDKEKDTKEIEEKKESVQEKPEEHSFQGVKYGVRGGYNISNLDIDGSPISENKHRNSIYIGFFANIGLSKTISLVPEIQFSAEGANAEPLNLDYIQAPILLRFRFSEKFHAGFGPQVGLKVHKYEDGMANFAYSGVAGVEYKVNYAIFVDARYTYGFRNVFDEKTGVTAKNTNIQIGVGYKF